MLRQRTKMKPCPYIHPRALVSHVIPYTDVSVRYDAGAAKERWTKSLGKIWNGAGAKVSLQSEERQGEGGSGL